jgi:uncharacterized damage-inducible protein DinB
MTRTTDEISTLFAYNRWANARILQPVSELTAEEMARDLGGSFPSVHETLAHIYAAEWIWLERWNGRSRKALPTGRDVPTLEALREKWRTIEDACRDFVAGLTDARLTEVIGYVNVKGETWRYALSDMLVHVANHSTYHRGQVVSMLRQLGRTPLSTDYLVFLDCGAPR